MPDASYARRQKLTSFTARLHHHATTNRIKRVGGQAGDSGDGLSDHPADNDVGVLWVWKHACGREVLVRTAGEPPAPAQTRHRPATAQRLPSSAILVNLPFAVS